MNEPAGGTPDKRWWTCQAHHADREALLDEVCERTDGHCQCVRRAGELPGDGGRVWDNPQVGEADRRAPATRKCGADAGGAIEECGERDGADRRAGTGECRPDLGETAATGGTRGRVQRVWPEPASGRG